jgi:hypothetical protein
MKKLLTGGVLIMFLFLNNSLFANPSFSPEVLTSPSIDDLSKRLIADKDFQNFTMSVYDFLKKIKTSNTVVMFKKYFSKGLTPQGKANFISQSCFVTEEGFIKTCQEIYAQKIMVTVKFPELFNTENKSIIESSALKVAGNKLQNIKPLVLDCWTLFCAGVLSCNINCGIYYPNNYFECWEPCFTAVSAAWGLCQLLES